MAAKIRLQRIGARNRPFYRVVVQDESLATGGNVIEVLGKYHPLSEPTLFEVNEEKTKAWLKKGAMPTDRVRILLGKVGILPAVDLAALPKRKAKGEAAPAEATTPAAPAAAPAETAAAPAAEAAAKA